ncbi:hypothetical protein MTR67_020258 [Solanum verrucosum]|uniref:Uncharacterized protein n=1 Tax=Solanum verrucosum TaxID=315347 RepID=A0AAF0TVM3_SOLVR|nr:hypothetical protein MTR67_020258 [Solanum verrucosum]
MNLKQLESLDLSSNHLIGKIPPQMTQLDSLSTLNLAFNHLSGKIPFENKFVTFEASSYRGNKELCGPPLENDCVFSSPPQQHEEEEEDEKQGIGTGARHIMLRLIAALNCARRNFICPNSP